MFKAQVQYAPYFYLQIKVHTPASPSHSPMPHVMRGYNPMSRGCRCTCHRAFHQFPLFEGNLLSSVQ